MSVASCFCEGCRRQANQFPTWAHRYTQCTAARGLFSHLMVRMVSIRTCGVVRLNASDRFAEDSLLFSRCEFSGSPVHIAAMINNLAC